MRKKCHVPSSLQIRPFDSIKPRVGDMRLSLCPGARGPPGPTSVQASYLQCSRRGPVELPPQQPGDLAGRERTLRGEPSGQGSRRVIAGAVACSRGLRTNTATTAILTVSSSRCQMTAQQGRGRVGPRSPAGAGQWQGTTPACPASRSASWAEGRAEGRVGGPSLRRPGN